MNLLFWSRGTRPYSRVCEGEAFPLELFIFHVNEEKVKAMVFPVVIYGCESWTIKKAECPRINAFELWCWRTLENPWLQRDPTIHPKGDQSWVFIGRTDVEAETPILWLPDVKN